MASSRILQGFVVLLTGLLVFLVQMTFVHQLPWDLSLWIRLGLSALLLILSMSFVNQNKKDPFGVIFYLFFVASTAVLVSQLTGNWILGWFGLDTGTPAGIAVAKFSESVPVILVILILTRIGGISPEALYLQKGNLKQGLIMGFLFFAGFTALTFLTGNVSPLFNEKLEEGSGMELMGLIPWVLLFVFCNAFMEELLFRGLFLKYFESRIGFRWANILTALVFSVAHMQVTYATNMIGFLIVVFILGILLGSAMKKTDSIIAPTLIHAGADVMLILPMFS